MKKIITKLVLVVTMMLTLYACNYDNTSLADFLQKSNFENKVISEGKVIHSWISSDTTSAHAIVDSIYFIKYEDTLYARKIYKGGISGGLSEYVDLHKVDSIESINGDIQYTWDVNLESKFNYYYVIENENLQQYFNSSEYSIYSSPTTLYEKESTLDQGIWDIKFFIDDFKEPTDVGYIKTTVYDGSFSNSATTGADLTAEFIIKSASEVDIMLYEYAGSHTVKTYGTDYYKVLVKDQNGKSYKLSAENWSDRLSFNKSDSKIIHNIFLAGGKVKFFIIEKSKYGTSSEYSFTVKNSDFYDITYAKLTKD